jgi:hypothetical protein
MNYIKILALITFTVFLFAACSTLMLSPAEFGWPIESVLKVDDKGFAKDDRYSLSFNTKPLFFEETQDSMSFSEKSLRLIRSSEGFYFVTASSFKNVYVFSVNKNAFELENKMLINENGLKNPAFNQRPPFIELIDDGITYKLTSEGLDGGKK